MKLIIVLALLFIQLAVSAQPEASEIMDDSKPSFILPVDIPISLAGNFGELRPGHFHAGLDIRTQGREGIPVRSIERGKVSRIAISLYGYGKVVYVDHPNGLTSVYAHLKRFSDPLENWVKALQYDKRAFEFDTSLTLSDEFILEQGELVGLSGNTGGSGGPHLHFEVRNTKTEKPINPLHFYKEEITDKIPPKLLTLSIYPLNNQSSVNGKNDVKHIQLNNDRLPADQVIEVNGKIGFGIETRDYINGSPFRNGVYSIELLKNGKRVYMHRMDSLSFDHTRCINAHMDYHAARKYKKKVQRSYSLEGNKLSIYDGLVNEGKLFFLSDTTYHMEYIVRDYFGNQSNLKFKVRSTTNVSQNTIESTYDILLKYGQENRFESENVKIYWPASCLYQDLAFTFGKKEAIGRCVTPRYQVQNLYEPLNDYMDLSINISEVDSTLHDKCVVMSLDEKSKVIAAEGGEVDNGWITCKTRSFGPYTVFVDTISPKMKPINWFNGKDVSGQRSLQFTLNDNISGLKKYEAFVDGQWTLVEYERNKKRAFISLTDLDQKQSKRKLTLRLTDAVGNTFEKDYSIFY